MCDLREQIELFSEHYRKVHEEGIILNSNSHCHLQTVINYVHCYALIFLNVH